MHTNKTFRIYSHILPEPYTDADQVVSELKQMDQADLQHMKDELLVSELKQMDQEDLQHMKDELLPQLPEGFMKEILVAFVSQDTDRINTIVDQAIADHGVDHLNQFIHSATDLWQTFMQKLQLDTENSSRVTGEIGKDQLKK